jgi:hypothetical protein
MIALRWHKGNTNPPKSQNSTYIPTDGKPPKKRMCQNLTTRTIPPYGREINQINYKIFMNMIIMSILIYRELDEIKILMLNASSLQRRKICAN